MKTNYTITGMTCSSCEAKVTEALKSVKHVTDVSVSKDTNSGTIQSSKPIEINELRAVLDNKYTITSIETNTPEKTNEASKSWLATYKPILLIFGFKIPKPITFFFISSVFTYVFFNILNSLFPETKTPFELNNLFVPVIRR